MVIQHVLDAGIRQQQSPVADGVNQGKVLGNVTAVTAFAGI